MEECMEKASKKALIVANVSGFVPRFEMNNVKILQEMGYQVHFAANFNTVVYEKNNAAFVNTGIIKHSIHFTEKMFSLNTYKCYKELKRLIEKEKFDLIHCHMPITGILTRIASNKISKKENKKIPIIYTVHGFHFAKGLSLKDWLYLIPERMCAKYTDSLLVINNEDYKQAQKFKVRGKLEYIQGVGLKPYKPSEKKTNIREELNIDKDTKILINISELCERKNQQRIIKIMDSFRNENVICLICGDGEKREELQSMIKEMYLEDKVKLLGYREDALDILQDGDIFISTSSREGLSLSILEAMQAGLPIVARNIRGNNDLIEDGVGGMLVEEDETRRYIKVIKYILNNPEVAKSFGQNNKKNTDKFSIDKVDKEMRRIYKEY